MILTWTVRDWREFDDRNAEREEEDDDLMGLDDPEMDPEFES